jgi:lipoate-protein ligase A
VRVLPGPLLDYEPLRTTSRPTIRSLSRTEPLIVLGSTQSPDDLDGDAVERDGIELRRRRGGGGAVLLHPEDLWFELWLPRDAVAPSDVRATACKVGDVWHEAMRSVGIAAEVHRGGMDDRPQGAIACFAGTGPGELTVAGAKLIGISQWRVREGTLVSSVLAVRPPQGLSRYLLAEVPRLEQANSLDSLDRVASADPLAQQFVHTVAGWLFDLDVQQLD